MDCQDLQLSPLLTVMSLMEGFETVSLTGSHGMTPAFLYEHEYECEYEKSARIRLCCRAVPRGHGGPGGLFHRSFNFALTKRKPGQQRAVLL